jgi:protein-tyrosine-phosphatase
MQDHDISPDDGERGTADGARAALRRFARAARHTPDRALHALRRYRLRQRLARNGLPRSVVFICTGNICRSPYAAHRFAATLPDALRSFMTVGSAGFIGPDRGTPRNGLTASAARGIDLHDHRSHVITAEIVRDVDLLVVMEAAQAARLRTSFRAAPERIVLLGDLDPGPIDTRTVRDPIFQPVQVFEETYDRIDRCVRELYRAIAGDHPVEGPVESAERSPAEVPARVDPRPAGGPPLAADRSSEQGAVASVRH